MPRIPLAILLLTLAAVTAGQLLALRSPVTPARTRRAEPVDDAPAGDPDPLGPSVTSASASDLERIRANVTFWGDRFRANQRDFISATRLAGDRDRTGPRHRRHQRLPRGRCRRDRCPRRGRRLPAGRRLSRRRPRRAPSIRGREGARYDACWPTCPNDPTALATLGDAALELGDVAAAAGAYQTLALVDDSSAARVRLSHLAFIQGRTDEAVGRVPRRRRRRQR